MATTPASFADFAFLRTSISVRGKHVSIVLAVTVHVLLVALLIYGIRWQTQRAESIEVELVRASPLEPAPLPEVRPEPKAAPLPAVKVEVPPPRPDIALKDKLKEKAKPLPVPEVKPARPDPFQKLLDQELKQATSERKTVEFANAATQELAQLRKAQAAGARSKAEADYKAKIVGKIRSRIPASALPPGNPVAEFSVSQLPSGEVLEVQRRRSSGYPAYDDAIERAIHSSSPLPKPDMGEVARDLILTFCPDEEHGCK
jgi:colicin import membrane protein